MRWLRRLGWPFTRATAPDEVSTLRARLRNDPSIAALLVAHCSPHGYNHDTEIVQRHDGTLWIRGRGPFKDEFSAWQPHPESIDLTAALPKFQAEAPHLRATASEASRIGRLGELGLATSEDAEWVVCRYPLVDEPPDGTMRDLLWRIAHTPVSG